MGLTCVVTSLIWQPLVGMGRMCRQRQLLHWNSSRSAELVHDVLDAAAKAGMWSCIEESHWLHVADLYGPRRKGTVLLP